MKKKISLWPYIWTLLLFVCTGCGFLLFRYTFLNWSIISAGDVFIIFALWAGFELAFIMGCVSTIITDKTLGRVSFTIYEYEKWDPWESDYAKRYYVTIRYKMEKYVYEILTKSYEEEMSPEELLKLLNRDESHNGFVTKQAALHYIYELVENSMKKTVDKDKIIINLKSVETFTEEQVKTDISDGNKRPKKS